MILLLLLSLSFAENPLCKNQISVDPQFQRNQEKVEKAIAEASHLAPIAAESDRVLSKLLQAKSPVLLSWLKKRNLMSAKEEVIAQKWRQYYLQNFILRQYPTKQSAINSSIEKLFQDINELSFSKEYKKNVESVFQEAKQTALNTVKSWSIDKAAQKQILERLGGIQLYWFEKLEGSPFATKPLEFMNWGVAYDPPFNRINIGLHILRYPNSHNLFTVFSHEMGHAFDPCRWVAFMTGATPFSSVIQCLREASAAGALVRDDGAIEKMLSQKKLSADMKLALEINPTCNPHFYPPRGIQKDQIQETWADWFSAEVLSRSPHLVPGFRADLCEKRDLEPGSSYLTNEARLTKVYLAHPQIAAQFKEKPSAKHCAL